MKRKHNILVIVIIAISVLLHIKGYQTIAAEEKDKVTILFTHDLHDNFLPLKEKEDDTVKVMGGYGRLLTAIKEQRLEDPEALLVDGGDFSMGTQFQTIFMSDAPELRLMGRMGYDVVTLGNHEYDYRAEGLARSLTAALNSGERLPFIVQAGVNFPKDKEGNMTSTLTELKQSMVNYGVKDYTVMERNGVRIGIFGFMGEESASMAPMSEVEFTDTIEEAKRIVKLLKEKEEVELILCLSHSGTNPESKLSEDELLAKKVPDIDIIISGHTHTDLPEPIVVGDTMIGSSEDYGKKLGVIKVEKVSEGSWKLDEYKLVEITDRFEEDPALSDKINYFKTMVQEKYFDNFNLGLDDIVAYSDYQLETPEELSAFHGEANIGNLISDAYRYAVKQAEGDNYIPVAAAIVPNGTIRDTIYPGSITAADAFRISSLGIGADGMPGYPLISVYLTGKELKTATEVDASITPIMDEAQLYMSGLQYTFNPKRLIFNKITKVSLVREDGFFEDLEDDRLYRVVCGLYSAQMLSVVGEKSYGLMSIVPKTKEGDPITDFEAHIIYDSSEGNNRELKEWYAIVQYLRSFEEKEGVPQLPEYYSQTQGRKIVDNNSKLTAIISNPNHIALTVYIAIPTVFILIFTIIIIINRRRKRRHQ